MPDRFDVIVVGIGAMGAAACYHLARRGARVLGLEQFDIPHALGSSHGFSRMTRMAYHEHPDYVPLLKSAFSMWHDLEIQGGQKLIYVTGGLYIGPREKEIVAGAAHAAEKYRLPHELLDRAALRARYPMFNVPDDYVGLLEQNAGFIIPEKAIATHALLAMQQGARLHGRETVVDWSTDQTGVKITTNRQDYFADQILFCGGAWNDRLLKNLGVTLHVTRQVLGWVWPKNPSDFALGKFPSWGIDHLDGSMHYGFPMTLDSPGLKIAHHHPGESANPDTVRRSVSVEDEQTFRPVLERFLPGGNGPLLSMRVCLYTNSPDGHFIIDRHPQHSRVHLAAGFSGHGFKFSPVVGQALAERIIDGRSQHEVEFLGLSRFN